MNLEIAFQTQQLPAPFAYAVLIKIDITSSVYLSFEMNYLDREELSEDEIVSEGFNPDDDFLWKGNLGENWKSILLGFKNFDYKKKSDENFYLYVLIDGVERGFPQLANDLLVQELIQGVFEASGKEEPLMIKFFEKGVEISVIWKFATREVLVNNKSGDWNKGYELMRQIFSNNLEQPKATFKKPQNKSLSLEPDCWQIIDDLNVWRALESLH